MHKHRAPKAVVGLLSAVAALLLMALPASANTVDVELDGGTLHLYQLFDPDPFVSIPLGTEEGVDCAPSDNSITFSGGPSSGSISGSIVTLGTSEIPPGSGDWFLVELTITITGSWTQPPEAISGNIDAVAQVWPVSGEEDCTPDADPCVVTANNIAFTGTTTTAGSLPNLATGDTATINGSNSDFDTTVSGEANSCGALIAVDNGHVELDSVLLTVV